MGEPSGHDQASRWAGASRKQSRHDRPSATVHKRPRSRSRSRSPATSSRKHQRLQDEGHAVDSNAPVSERQRDAQRARHTSHSHHHHHHHHHHHPHPHRPHRSHRTRSPPDDDRPLPHGARRLTLHDFATFRPLLAHYLDEEKHVCLAGNDGLDDRDVRSRWKRFVDKWNHLDLADRWYEPQQFLRAVRAHAGTGAQVLEQAPEQAPEQVPEQKQRPEDAGEHDGRNESSGSDSDNDSDSDSDDFGPRLPPPPPPLEEASTKPVKATTTSERPHGPAIPSLGDLAERRALAEEDREAKRAALRLARKADRAAQRERLDELVPRAAAGTRERQLEKRQALNEKLRGFRDRSPGGGGLEVSDDVLMSGGGGGGEDDQRKTLAAQQRRRTQWEVYREEERRARDAELNERRRQYRAREDETMSVLKELARQRYG
ncbi:hypothetical protein SPI_00456 [Niveomyces insectorum RCEF 264]|uniref:Uncharacterized protein n=1 Tax=Niveomyces insectorum RCEF 264 TaxID=1081102 RepID=A0A168A568_9HYPO|nr:hypothetical protein SPI_00456 [Niveomyces insectorum RCEF 264]